MKKEERKKFSPIDAGRRGKALFDPREVNLHRGRRRCWPTPEQTRVFLDLGRRRGPASLWSAQLPFHNQGTSPLELLLRLLTETHRRKQRAFRTFPISEMITFSPERERKKKAKGLLSRADITQKNGGNQRAFRAFHPAMGGEKKKPSAS